MQSTLSYYRITISGRTTSSLYSDDFDVYYEATVEKHTLNQAGGGSLCHIQRFESKHVPSTAASREVQAKEAVRNQAVKYVQDIAPDSFIQFGKGY